MGIVYVSLDRLIYISIRESQNMFVMAYTERKEPLQIYDRTDRTDITKAPNHASKYNIQNFPMS